MKLSAIFLMLCLMPVGTPSAAFARATDISGCPTSPAKFAQTPKLTLPEDAKPTSKFIAFEVDIGSDGRVRGLQLDHASGDGAIDLGLRQQLQAATYQPPETGCVVYSGGLYISYSLSADGSAAPPQPTALVSTCTPFVSAFLTPVARDRKKTGTAFVTVDLDASGTRSGPPVLRKSTGSPVLDQEALRIAATGHYSFLRQSSCTPQALGYPLELTFQ